MAPNILQQVLYLIILEFTASQIYAPPQIVASNGQVLIRLGGYDTYGAQRLTATVSGASELNGRLSQLSRVFSTYGYEPKAGDPIINNDSVVTGSLNRVLYTPNYVGTQSQISKLDSFTYRLSNGTSISLPGYIIIVSADSGGILGFDFNEGNNQGWYIYGNQILSEASFEPSSRGSLLNYYIYGSDDEINVDSRGGDTALWYFQAPQSSLVNLNVAYKGYLRFDLSALAGDFSQLNPPSTNVVELECSKCNGPNKLGLTLGFPISALSSPFNGSTTTFTLSLDETFGWLKDPQNVLLQWSVPSQCDMINVLSGLTALRILGDWTTWYETIAMDNVMIYNLKCTANLFNLCTVRANVIIAQLPLCAFGTTCSC